MSYCRLKVSHIENKSLFCIVPYIVDIFQELVLYTIKLTLVQPYKVSYEQSFKAFNTNKNYFSLRILTFHQESF